MKEVYVVYGTVNVDDEPDYSIHGVFSQYDEAKNFIKETAVQAFDKLDVDFFERMFEIDPDGKISVYDGENYRVFLKLEIWEVK